jgi:hypothetical protein
MSGFCYEHLPFNPGKIKRRPMLAMDAAPPPSGNRPMIGDDAFKQVLEVLKDQLDEQTFGKVRDALAGFTKMSMDQPAARAAFDPKNVDRAADILRSKGVEEDTIGKLYEICGAEKPTHAMDEREYYERFPDATRIGGALTFDTTTAAAKRRREAEPMSDIESYLSRFSEASHIKHG